MSDPAPDSTLDPALAGLLRALLPLPAAEPTDDVRDAGLIARAHALARDLLAPRANAVDQADLVPVDSLRALAAAGLLGLTIPSTYGGSGASRSVVSACTAALAAACGVTTFVLERHLLACRQLAFSQAAIRERLLPEFAAGRLLCGRATTHVLRADPPPLRAARTADGGACFDGTAPWLTGWGLMHEAVLGATLDDGTLLFALVPLHENAALAASPPLRLCAMNASGTVALTCHGVQVGPERVLGTTTRQAMAWQAELSALGHVTHPLAVTDAALALLRELAASRGQAAPCAAAAALAAEAAALRAQVRHWRGQPLHAAYRAVTLRLVGWAHDLSVRATHAVVTATGGRANSRERTAQRLYREAMFYTIYLQPPGLQTAMLAWLAEGAREAVARGTVPPAE